MSKIEKSSTDATGAGRPSAEAAASEFRDPVIEAYKQHVDRTLLRENLKLTVEERFQRFEQFMELVAELRRAKRR
ncbi:MAG TPA: hypothetical protein V6D08_03560 [Candidatus Obscuribacterales bacterium]